MWTPKKYDHDADGNADILMVGSIRCADNKGPSAVRFDQLGGRY